VEYKPSSCKRTGLVVDGPSLYAALSEGGGVRRRTKTKTWLREVLQHDALHVPFEPQKIRLLVTHSQRASERASERASALAASVPIALIVQLRAVIHPHPWSACGTVQCVPPTGYGAALQYVLNAVGGTDGVRSLAIQR